MEQLEQLELFPLEMWTDTDDVGDLYARLTYRAFNSTAAHEREIKRIQRLWEAFTK